MATAIKKKYFNSMKCCIILETIQSNKKKRLKWGFRVEFSSKFSVKNLNFGMTNVKNINDRKYILIN